MIKFGIKFGNGTYWRNHGAATPDINEAHTFILNTGAGMTAFHLKLTDFKIVPIELTFGQPGPARRDELEVAA